MIIITIIIIIMIIIIVITIIIITIIIIAVILITTTIIIILVYSYSYRPRQVQPSYMNSPDPRDLDPSDMQYGIDVRHAARKPGTKLYWPPDDGSTGTIT